MHEFISVLQCEPLGGYGFRRGGYQCVCLPGHYYPWWHDGPFQGWEIEQATLEEYEFGYDCIPAESKYMWMWKKNNSLLGFRLRALGSTVAKSTLN